MTNEEVSKKTNKLNYTNHIANTVGADAPVRPQKQNGITLIALVITIIVMLILVAVTVTIAINGGLFGMAKDAKADTEKELAKENALSTGRVKIGDQWYDSMEDYVNGKPSKNQSDDSAGGVSGTGHGGTYDEAEKNGDGTLKDKATWEENGKTAVIPKGFKVVAGKDGEQSIDSGLVIQDKDGNEFVWIPVTYEATGEQDEHGLYEGFKAVFYISDWSNNSRKEFIYDGGGENDHIEPNWSGEGYPNEAGEYYKMMLSVQENKGFYIGRYEAGSETARTETSGDTTMVVKRDQYPYNYVAWGNDMNDIESEIDSSGHGAVYLSKHMYEDGDNVGVVSTLCYGVQWDAMLDFIKDEKDVSDSTEWGNYKDNQWTINRAEAKYYSSSKWNSISEEEGQQKSKDDSTSILLTTGASDSFSAKNIYDVAGNCGEWTMEVCTPVYRVKRGGNFYDSRSSYPASSRYESNPSNTDNCYSFRLALYIKNSSF